MSRLESNVVCQRAIEQRNLGQPTLRGIGRVLAEYKHAERFDF